MTIYPRITAEQYAADRARHERLPCKCGTRREITAEADATRLRSQVAALREALEEARDDVASWGDYASPYFQEKWDLKGNLKRIDDILASTERLTDKLHRGVGKIHMSNEDLDDRKVTMPQAFTAIRADAAAKNRKQGTVVCPRCGGELGYSISSYNGHIHGQCNTTRGCLSWMM